MKISIILFLLISFAFSKEISILEFCKIKAQQQSEIIVGKKSKKLEYVYNKQLDYCTLELRGMKLKYPSPIFTKMREQLSQYYNDYYLTPEEFNKVIDLHGKSFNIDIKKYGFDKYYLTPVLTLNEMKRKECKQPNLSVYGIKLGCRYDYQKSMKLNAVDTIHNNNDTDIIIKLPQDNKPYEYIRLAVIPSSGEIARIDLYLWNPSTDKSSITYSECIKISNDLLTKYHSKFDGNIKLAAKKSYGMSGAKLDTEKYSLYLGCTDSNNNEFTFTDNKLYKIYKEEIKLYKYNKNINKVF